MIRFCAVLLIFLLVLRPVWAQDPVGPVIAGQDDPAFQAAVALWLADSDELAALGDLAGLAQAGNRAAQVLLALIDKGPGLQGPDLSGLPRDARVLLLRQPGGISGQSWMRAAAQDVPLAHLWTVLWQADAPPGIVLDFARIGEARAARVAVLALRSRQDHGLETLAAAPDFPVEMRFALWEAALPGADMPQLAARMGQEAAAMAAGDPQRAMAGLEDGAALDRWMQSAAVAAPVNALCTDLCAETYDTCTQTAMAAVGGYRGLTALGSPAEAVIPTATFAASPKGRSDLLRRALLRWSMGGRGLALDRVAARDACFGAALAGEAARY